MPTDHTDTKSSNIQAVYRALDYVTVALLLTGQISIGGVFLTSGGGFSLSLSGPFTGSALKIPRREAPSAGVVIRFVEVVAALLVILDQINVIGTFVTSGEFTIVVSGPPFGEAKRIGYAPAAR
ncbi:MAG TPA: hypothetical protein VFV52_05565, partial [Bacilli bacterium]|nr:hypothetical protein [Bacilli bacterium]